jgi:hypothetical protein
MSIVLDGTSGITTNSGTVVSTTDATLNGLTVGKGAGSVSTNTAVGVSALNSNGAGQNNTAFGYQAGYSNVIGNFNTYVGSRGPGYNATGDQNAFFGDYSGRSVTTGAQNTFLGQSAGSGVTTGSKNTIIGGYGGNQGGLDIRTSSNYIVLSDGDGNPRAYFNAYGCFNVPMTVDQPTQAAIFRNNAATTSNQYGVSIILNGSPNNGSNYFISCPDSGGSTERFTVRTNGGVANYSANNVNLSDQREKKDIELAPSYLDKVCAIPVKTFLFNDQTDTDKNLGVIAQDVEAVAPELVMESNWGTTEEPKMRLSIYQTDLQYALMKSIQELKAIVDAQAAEIAALKPKA